MSKLEEVERSEKKTDSQGHPQPVSPTSISVESKFPSLEYDLASHKLGITLSALLIVSVNGVIPAIVYYILQYGTSSSRPLVITVVEAPTSIILLHWPYRLWLLKKRKRERSPKNAGTFALDTFQWNFLFGAILVFFFCTIAGIQERDGMRWYILGFVALFGVTSISLLTTWLLARLNVRMPFRVSSVPAKSVFRPGIYHFIEDIVGCEGGGGRAYRERLNVRWESSPLFRELLSQITLVFGVSLLVQTGVQLVILFTISEKVFVGLTTVLLWIWVGLTLLWGWRFSQSRIRLEKERWRVDTET